MHFRFGGYVLNCFHVVALGRIMCIPKAVIKHGKHNSEILTKFCSTIKTNKYAS